MSTNNELRSNCNIVAHGVAPKVQTMGKMRTNNELRSNGNIVAHGVAPKVQTMGKMYFKQFSPEGAIIIAASFAM